MTSYKKYGAAAFIATLLFFGFYRLSAAESPWMTVRETSDGIVVKSRETEGTTVRAVLASMEVAAPPKSVIDVAGDPKTFDSAENHLDDHRVYKTDNPDIWHVYYLVNFPFIARRDYTLRYEKTVDPAKPLFQLSWHAAPKIGPPASEDIIRVTLADGWIKAVPNVKGTGCSVLYYVKADPGGNIPGWVMNIANKMTIPDILRQIRDAALRKNQSQSVAKL